MTTETLGSEMRMTPRRRFSCFICLGLRLAPMDLDQMTPVSMQSLKDSIVTSMVGERKSAGDTKCNRYRDPSFLHLSTRWIFDSHVALLDKATRVSNTIEHSQNRSKLAGRLKRNLFIHAWFKVFKSYEL